MAVSTGGGLRWPSTKSQAGFLLQHEHPTALKMHTQRLSGDEVEYKPLQMASITATSFHPSTPSELLLGSFRIRGGGSEKVLGSIFNLGVLPKALHSSYPHFPQNFVLFFPLLMFFLRRQNTLFFSCLFFFLQRIT